MRPIEYYREEQRHTPDQVSCYFRIGNLTEEEADYVDRYYCVMIKQVLDMRRTAEKSEVIE